MTHYLLSVYQPDGPIPSQERMQKITQDIEALNKEMRAAGAWVFAPKGVPHAFRVGEAGARMLTFSAPAGFADFVRAAGEPAAGLRLPPPGPLDVERLSAVAARYGIAIVGPPPEPVGA